MIQNRADFLRKLIRIIMISVLGFIATVLGSRTVSGSGCASCSGKGICNGISDCSIYSGNEYGKK